MKKILSGIILSLLIFSQAFASARVIIPAGNQLKINAESDIINGDYSWVLLSSDGYILNNQNGQIFTTKFQKAGKYKLNVTVTDKQTGKTKFTQTEIIVGNPNKFWNDFSVNIDSLPKIKENNEIHFPENSGKINFFFGNSKGIKKIYLDKNIDEDSDGDGINDNDNVLEKTCPTFEKCQQFNVNLEELKTGDLKIKFTFEGFSGKKEERIFKILFNQKEIKPDDFLLKINSLPKINPETNEIFVPFGIDEIILNLEESSGDFLEYQIDTDTEKDSDSDGKKDNDIDNKNHQSYKDGTSFIIKKGTKNSQTIKATIFSGKNKKSEEIKIVWGKENENKDINVYSSTNQNFVKKEIYFGIENLDTEKYFAEWDFDGDGKIDEKNKIYTSYKFKKEGNYETKIFIKDKETKEIFKESSLKIEIKKPVENQISTSKPKVDFDFEMNGPNVNFAQKTEVDSKLLNQNFKSLWKFGNGNISNEKNPIFLYTKTGTYLVELTITDSAGNSEKTEKKIEITDLGLKEEIPLNGTETGEVIDFFEEGENNGEELEGEKIDFFEDEENSGNGNNSGEKDEKPTENGSDFLSNFLLRLAILIASILGIIGIYLIIQKIKYPDMDFGEILDEEREKILSWIEGEEYEHPVEHISEEIHNEVEKIEEVKKEEKVEEKVEIKKETGLQNQKNIENKTDKKTETGLDKPEPKPEEKPKNPFADFGKDKIQKQEENNKPEVKKEENPFKDFGKEKNTENKPEEKKSDEKNFSDNKKNFPEPKKNFGENKNIPEKKPEIKKPETNPFADFGKDRIQKETGLQNQKNIENKNDKKIETGLDSKPKKPNIPSPPPPPTVSQEKKKIEKKDEDDDIPDFLK